MNPRPTNCGPAITPPPTPAAPYEPQVATGHRGLQERLRETAGAIDRSRQGGQPDTDRLLVQIYDGGSIPTQPMKVFLGHPVEIDADDVEGSTPSFSPDTTQTIPTVVIRGAVAAGDYLVAHSLGGRWVAERGGTPPQACRWICGPYVQFDTPAGSGPGCTSATAAVTVGAGGIITGATLVAAGSCYTVAHPAARVLVGPSGQPGSGATLQATVGEIVSLTVTNGGGGYDPLDPPAVTITPAGPGATAHATVNPTTGAVTALTLTNPGSLFLVAAPTVVIAPPPGAGVRATAVAAAKPGVVTSLKVVTAGSGYIDNTPPERLDFTISCPAWSFAVTVVPGFVPGTTPAGPPPPGTLPYCPYAGQATVRIPATAVCPPVDGVVLTVSLYGSRFFGYILTVNWNLTGDPALTFTCNGFCEPLPGHPGANTLWCMTTGTPGGVFVGPGADSPGGTDSPITPTCSARPYSWSGSFGALPYFGGCATLPVTGWYVIVGGACQGIQPNGNYPVIPITMTLTEP